jgi:hypothetical protein
MSAASVIIVLSAANVSAMNVTGVNSTGIAPIAREIMTTLEKIEALYGTVRAFDGRLAFWTVLGNTHDVRDVATRLGLDPGDVVDAMPEFKLVKRGKAHLNGEAESEPETDGPDLSQVENCRENG